MFETLITQDEVNSRVYHSHGISGAYRGKLLEPAEAMALLTYCTGFTGRNVLDVGVGTGRTASYLSPLARRYVCIDYSAEMVEYIRATLPGTEVHLADMRDLTAWDAAAFDFILATNNVLDAVSHDGRLKTLGEAHRVLSTDGLLLFSSHNRRYRMAQSGPSLEYSRNPASQAIHLVKYAQRLVNYLRIRGQRRFEEEYAILNDIGHDYRLLHYYIDRDVQLRQLAAAGFRLLDVFDSEGRRLRSGDDDTSSPSLMYVAARA